MWVYFPYKSTYQEGLVNGQVEQREIADFSIDLKSMAGYETALKSLSKDDAKTLKTQITRFMEYLKDSVIVY